MVMNGIADDEHGDSDSLQNTFSNLVSCMNMVVLKSQDVDFKRSDRNAAEASLKAIQFFKL